jgi:hypothetical protein
MVVGALLLVPQLAHAQDQAKVFVRPMVAATVGAGPGAVFGATFVIKANKINQKAQLLAEFGRMQNIMPSSVADQVDTTAAKVADSRGGKGSSRATASANYGMGGFRYRLRDVNEAQTFFEFGVGAANVRSHVSAQIRGSETLQGDISNLVSTPFTSTGPQTKPLAAIGGGMILGVNHRMAVEMGYRYVRVFTKSPAIGLSKIFGGVQLGF